MIIINHKEKKLSLVHGDVHGSEGLSYLVSSLLAAVRWYGLTDYGSLYNDFESLEYNDSKNLCVLATLIEQLTAIKPCERKPMELCIVTSTPDKLNKEIYKAIVASVRWNGMCLQERKRANEDAQHLAVIAILLEQFVDVTIIS